MNPNCLFVYGTLRRGTGHRMQAVLEARAEFVDLARFQGRMYRVARYPGVVDSESPADTVVGEVFRLPRPATLLRKLDRFEACAPGNPEAPYVRVVRPVRLESGDCMNTWIYLYNRSIAALEPIASGDYLAGRAGAARVAVP